MKRSAGGGRFHVPFSTKVKTEKGEDSATTPSEAPVGLASASAASESSSGNVSVPPRKHFQPPLGSFKPPGGGFVPPTALRDENAGSASTNVKEPAASGPVVQRFEALYTKVNGPKKRKVFSDVLVVETVGGNQKVMLESETGKCEGKKTLYGHHALGLGSEIVIGNFSVEVRAPRVKKVVTDDDACPPPESVTSVPSRIPLAPFKSFKPHSSTTANADVKLVKYEAKEGEIVLFDPWDEPASASQASLKPVAVPSFLGRLLRPHQVEGVKFLWKCLTGRGRMKGLGRGAVLADDMGLGKTLSSITITYVMLNSGTARKVAIVCPSSLVGQWAKEFTKWLSYRLKVTVVDGTLGKALGHGSATEQIKNFCSTASASVLILSYEAYRRDAETLNNCKAIELLICDEGHRLKSQDGSKTMQALGACPARARLLVTGTPIQNNLLEFHALINFVNPGVIGSLSDFRTNYQRPIEKGRDRKASETQKEYGTEKTRGLLRLVSAFMIRRSAQRILEDLLPGKKLDLVVFCRPTALQRHLYDRLLKQALRMGWGRGDSDGAAALKLMNVLRKCCNHPHLLLPDAKDPNDIEDASLKTVLTTGTDEEEECEDAGQLGFKSAAGKKKAGGSGKKSNEPPQKLPALDPALSGKLSVAVNLLQAIHEQSTDRVVLISTFTTTLDVLEGIAEQRKWKFCRLDGSVSVSSRSSLVDAFNRPSSSPTARMPDDPFLFLLSSRAGGVGLHLVGANRLVLFDSDWNPSIDQQCKSRVWRDQQPKDVFIYRLLTTGTLEEKILQRQYRKGELATTIVDDQKHNVRNFASGDTDQLFALSPASVRCETYNLLSKRKDAGWVDYTGPQSIADSVLRQVAETDKHTGELISFVHEEGALALEEDDEVIDVTLSDGEDGEEGHGIGGTGAQPSIAKRRREVVVEEEEWGSGDEDGAHERGGEDDEDAAGSRELEAMASEYQAMAEKHQEQKAVPAAASASRLLEDVYGTGMLEEDDEEEWDRWMK